MPIYEYKCKKCGYRFEKTRRITAAPIRRCPKCRGQVSRLLSSTTFILKGSGWYATDYTRKGKGKKTDTDKEEKPAVAKEEKKEEKKEKK